MGNCKKILETKIYSKNIRITHRSSCNEIFATGLVRFGTFFLKYLTTLITYFLSSFPNFKRMLLANVAQELRKQDIIINQGKR